MSTFKLITFDADDTLWDFTTMMERGTQAVSVAIQERLGAAYAYMTPEYLQKAQAKAIAKVDPQKVDWVEVRRTAFRGVLKKAKYKHAAAFADELVEIYLAARTSRYEFYPDVYTTLEALRGRFVLGWITNGVTMPAQVGMPHLFDFTITSETLGVRKPRPEVFLHAARLAGCDVGQMLHVGDELEADVSGALGAGAAAIWFNPRQRLNTLNLTPLAEVRSLSAVLEWV